MERRRRMSEVAERAVREGDVRILEQMVGGTGFGNEEDDHERGRGGRGEEVESRVDG